MVRLGGAGHGGGAGGGAWLLPYPAALHEAQSLSPPPLPPPWEAVWNGTKNEGLDILDLNPGPSLTCSGDLGKLLTHSAPQSPHL